MAKCLREKDHRNEEIVSSVMDNHFYTRFSGEWGRVVSKDLQLKGVDVVGERNGEPVFIDEKAQTHYVNQNLPTFAFELGFKHRGETVNGWLFDENKLTTHYLLMWLWGVNDELRSKQDLTKIQALFIDRDKIINFFKNKGFGRDRMSGLVKELVENDVDGRYDVGEDSFYLYRTTHLKEKPVNVVVKKNVLKGLSDAEHVLSK